MQKDIQASIEAAKKAAIAVLQHNAHNPETGLLRTAGWEYPEPYTRDMMISALGILISQDQDLINSLRKVFEALAQTQSRLGHMSSLANDPEDRGASDTTPLFLLAVYIYRQVTGEKDFLEEAIQKSLTWMEYQSPADRAFVAQQPTSDWRDEHWVLGFGLYVNTIVYSYLRLYGYHERADLLKDLMYRFTIRERRQQRHVHEGLTVENKPYFAVWSYKIHNSERFDLLGNSLAILAGLADQQRAKEIIAWAEAECAALQEKKELTLNLPPVLIPYINPGDPDWRLRYEEYNKPGEYHNGGIWPFVCGFYVAALVAAEEYDLAEEKLRELTKLVKPAREQQVEFGFNEWFKAQDGLPKGADWQTWSAAMYLYAAACVEQRKTPFFEEVRSKG
ncbi:MAG: amylo-alpha-1,6-glucosidase [Candidatus Margulisbacteria bacterium]|nr:amylo-alpha-1,6-glucosidase [Candidatus Margulisiibacteriota bacterium]